MGHNGLISWRKALLLRLLLQGWTGKREQLSLAETESLVWAGPGASTTLPNRWAVLGPGTSLSLSFILCFLVNDAVGQLQCFFHLKSQMIIDKLAEVQKQDKWVIQNLWSAYYSNKASLGACFFERGRSNSIKVFQYICVKKIASDTLHFCHLLDESTIKSNTWRLNLDK